MLDGVVGISCYVCECGSTTIIGVVIVEFIVETGVEEDLHC